MPLGKHPLEIRLPRSGYLTPGSPPGESGAMIKAFVLTAMSAALANSALAENEFRHVVLFKFKPEATADTVSYTHLTLPTTERV